MLILFWKTTCWSLRFRTLRYRFWDTADPLLGELINELEEGSARDSFTAAVLLKAVGALPDTDGEVMSHESPW